MPVPTLPNELLSEIIHLAAETPKFDFVRIYWGGDTQTGTLKSLCLVSHTFNSLATRHLYTHPVLPTGQSGLLFLRTVYSDR